MGQEANAFRVESKLFAVRKDSIFNGNGTRIAEKRNWIKGRSSTTFENGNDSQKPVFASMNRMANMRNKNVTRRIEKSRQRTPLTYSFGRNDPIWYLLD